MHKKLQDLPTTSLDSRLMLGGIALNELAPEPVSYPLVSFIICNWNYGRFVGTAIRSVRNQDYPNFEAIIVDNGSTDDSRAEIEAAVADDPRFRLLWLDRNLGALGGALKGLELAGGEFVCFLDSDDYLLSSFTPTHVQAHLSVAGRAAFTSSSVVEIDACGAVISLNSRSTGTPSKAQRPIWTVPRLSELSGAQFEQLQQSMTIIEPTQGGWPWSPGTANMFRRIVLELARPRLPDESLFGLSTDGHFCMLAHALGGSALIDIPLSAYRQHGANFFAGSSAISGLWQPSGPAAHYFALRRREALRVLVGQAEHLAPRMGSPRFWSSLAHLLEINGSSPRQDFEISETRSVISDNLDRLFALFGKWRTLRKLRVLMSRQSLHAIVRAGGHGDAATLLGPKMAGVEIAAMAERLKRRRRSPGLRLRSGPAPGS